MSFLLPSSTTASHSTHSLPPLPTQINPLIIVYPGGCGNTSLYEDDGITTNYATENAFSTQEVRCQSRSSTSITIEIDPFQAGSGGKYAPPANRRTLFRFPMSTTAASVLVDTTSVSYRRRLPGTHSNGSSPSWHFDGVDLAVVVDAGYLSTNQQHTITVKFNDIKQPYALNGVSVSFSCVVLLVDLFATMMFT